MESGANSNVGAFDRVRQDLDFDGEGRLLQVQTGAAEICDLRGANGGCHKAPPGPAASFRYENGKLTGQWSEGHSLYALTYDAAGRFERITYTPKVGRVETHTLKYSSDGSVSAVVRHNPGAKTQPRPEQLTHRIDGAGRTTHMERYGESVDITYRTNGLPDQVVLTRPGDPGSKAPVVYTYTYTWDEAGRLKRENQCSSPKDCSWFELSYRADGSLESAASYTGDPNGAQENMWSASFSEACALSVEPPTLPSYPALPNELRDLLDQGKGPVLRVVSRKVSAEARTAAAAPPVAPPPKQPATPGKAPPPNAFKPSASKLR